VCVHGVPPYALAWPQSHILAAGCDKRLTMYDPYGKPVKTFDFSRDSQEREITVACCSPSGQSVAVGSWDKVRIFDWSPRRSIWEETNVRDLPNFYTITALSWRRDGSKLIIGGLCGSVEQFETILRWLKLGIVAFFTFEYFLNFVLLYLFVPNDYYKNRNYLDIELYNKSLM